MSDRTRRKAQTPALEAIAAAIGLILLLAVAVVIGREALFHEDRQLPDIVVIPMRVAPAGNGFVVEFEARNRASATAAAVQIEGEVAGEETETSSVTLDYVPGGGKTGGGLYFRTDPRGRKIELRAAGFQAP